MILLQGYVSPETYLSWHGGAGTSRLCLRHSRLASASDIESEAADASGWLVLVKVLVLEELWNFFAATAVGGTWAASTHGRQSHAVVCDS